MLLLLLCSIRILSFRQWQGQSGYIQNASKKSPPFRAHCATGMEVTKEAGKDKKMILEKLHRAINSFNKAFNWRRFRRDALHLGESMLVFGVLYGIFSTAIWGVCWLTKINYDPDLVAVAWAVPVLLDTLVNKAYDWNNEVRDWD